MAFWRPNADLTHQSPARSGIGVFACLVAALLMLASTSYAAAHDHEDHGHDDHESDFEGECVVCASAILGGAKISPDEPQVFKPDVSLISIPPPGRFQTDDRFNGGPSPARGPPLPVASF